jgi:hypothetical protein
MEILTTYFLIDLFLWNNFNEYKNTRSKQQQWYRFLGLGIMVSNATFNNIYIIMWSCPGNMPKYYPGNMPKYYSTKYHYRNLHKE